MHQMGLSGATRALRLSQHALLPCCVLLLPCSARALCGVAVTVQRISNSSAVQLGLQEVRVYRSSKAWTLSFLARACMHMVACIHAVHTSPYLCTTCHSEHSPCPAHAIRSVHLRAS